MIKAKGEIVAEIVLLIRRQKGRGGVRVGKLHHLATDVEASLRPKSFRNVNTGSDSTLRKTVDCMFT